MPVNTDAILSVVAQLAEQENLRVTVRESAKGACIVGSSAFAGGIVGGPVGLCIGGIVGSFGALVYGKGKYRSVVDIILYDMSTAQRIRLADGVQRAVQDVNVEDFTILLPLILTQAPLKELALRELVRFIQNEMSMTIAA